MKEQLISFTHYWVDGFGWENTVYDSFDFQDVQFIGESEDEGKVYFCTNSLGNRQILRVYESN